MGGSVTSPVESKRTEASPSSTMGKIGEKDSDAFGPEGLSDECLCKGTALATGQTRVGFVGKVRSWLYLIGSKRSLWAKRAGMRFYRLYLCVPSR